jgi:Uma2 family endonuclease
MATAPTYPLVSVDEYLNSSYEHDMEYVDGVLLGRGMPTIAHSLLQGLVFMWFAQFEKALRFKTMLEVRTQIAERARYRIPDVMLCPRPLPKGKICDVVPWAVIEILSPDDTLAGTRERFEDYARIGVRELVLMDPEACIAYRFEAGSLIQTSFKSLTLPGSEVNFDSEELFSRLRQEREEQ